MPKHSYTVILVPHDGTQYRKLHLSSLRIRFLTILGGLGLVTVGVLGAQYARFSRDLSELRQLRLLNAELRRQNLDYEVSSEHLNQRVASLQDFVRKLSVMAGLGEDRSVEQLAGVGGPDEGQINSKSAYDEVRASLELMAAELRTLEEKSRVLERFYEQNSLMLASTPSVWPVRGYLSSLFGRRKDPFTGQPEMHAGIDISTPIGRPVVATADGMVVFASRQGSYGNTVVIDHKYGMMTLYGHLSKFDVRPGNRVKRGEVIGQVGNTGRSRGPHLHYEVWVSDRAVSPLDFILEYANTRNAQLREGARTAGSS